MRAGSSLGEAFGRDGDGLGDDRGWSDGLGAKSHMRSSLSNELPVRSHAFLQRAVLPLKIPGGTLNLARILMSPGIARIPG